MQHYQLVITANKRPETLERLLRVIRHRGFEVLSLNIENQLQGIHFDVTVQSDRAIELLKNQLVKLPDVMALKEC
ncbi:Acetolactate synthase isozyme 2 small subunit [Phocoenobacter uteri]|uniref:Acetolactate synthase isozyme 2 small subunit n=1 Tax=Phocoenobacter uteri TaxID=146806 RepID=A0A379C886_9PAST|nr:acetolactate synthase 2 small subunit [Phocoenobacter uteri]MDG6882264.1 acetolactate synthase [Phocoenobacter uteri]SUB58421.1 Acetolactate synthase isozyme 2 small subunit [Phocoenobacter uteri]